MRGFFVYWTVYSLLGEPCNGSLKQCILFISVYAGVEFTEEELL